MIVWFLFAWLLSPPSVGQAEQARVGCEGLKNHEFVYLGGQRFEPVNPQKYTVKKLQRRSIAGIPIPGGSGPQYQVKVSDKPQPVAVAESKPVFHVSSETPAEEIVAVRLTRCGNGDCFNLYDNGPASMAIVPIESRALGPGCYEFYPQRPLNPGDYALVILGPDFKPQQVARFIAGPTVPDIQLPK